MNSRRPFWKNSTATKRGKRRSQSPSRSSSDSPKRRCKNAAQAVPDFLIPTNCDIADHRALARCHRAATHPRECQGAPSVSSLRGRAVASRSSVQTRPPDSSHLLSSNWHPISRSRHARRRRSHLVLNRHAPGVRNTPPTTVAVTSNRAVELPAAARTAARVREVAVAAAVAYGDVLLVLSGSGGPGVLKSKNPVRDSHARFQRTHRT